MTAVLLAGKPRGGASSPFVWGTVQSVASDFMSCQVLVDGSTTTLTAYLPSRLTVTSGDRVQCFVQGQKFYVSDQFSRLPARGFVYGASSQTFSAAATWYAVTSGATLDSTTQGDITQLTTGGSQLGLVVGHDGWYHVAAVVSCNTPAVTRWLIGLEAFYPYTSLPASPGLGANQVTFAEYYGNGSYFPRGDPSKDVYLTAGTAVRAIAYVSVGGQTTTPGKPQTYLTCVEL